MLKFLSLLLIITASFLCGKQQSDAIYEKLTFHEGMLSLLGDIKRCVILYRMTLNEIIGLCEHEVLRKSGFLNDCLQHGIDRAYHDYKESFGFDTFSDKRMVDFIRCLGSLSVSEQIVACEEMIELLKKDYDAKVERYPNQRKLYLTLGTTIGLGIVIMLV